ncbi:hypothetical protein B0J14DRAFT_655956 [Halenospora varia]|nr:hypothetical protein B0J14DRAFT_655956 [Halenospora varia]
MPSRLVEAKKFNAKLMAQSLPHIGIPRIGVMEGTQDDCAVARRGKEGSMEHRRWMHLHNARKTYLLARAPPLSRTQRIFNITPRIIFQLQELSSLVRPEPVIDVVATNNYAPRLSQGGWLGLFTRRKMWRDIRIMVLKIEDYGTTQHRCSDDTVKEALAVIVSRNGDNQEAEICLAGGSTWKATCSPSGVFEFILETGASNRFSVAKWRPVWRIDHEINAPPTSAADGDPAQEQQYRFSVIHPGRRRHPVLASLTPTRLEIAENCASINHDHGRSGVDLVSPDEASDESGNSRALKEMDGDMKTLIQVTAIWVTLSLGCCTSFNMSGHSSCPGQPSSDLKASNHRSEPQSP